MQGGAEDPTKRKKVRYDVVPRATFTALQIGSVGLTEEQVIEQGLAYKVGYLPLSSTAQGYARGFLPGDLDDGFAKVIVSKEEERFLGVHIMAPEASSLVMPYVYLMAAAREEEYPADSTETIKWNMTIHPSLAEMPAWAIGNWRDEAATSTEAADEAETEAVVEAADEAETEAAVEAADEAETK